MYNYRIMRVSGLAVFRLLFVAGAVLGGIGGLILGLMERDAVGLLGGAFLGLVTGLGSGLTGLVYVLIFNLIAPLIGGIAIRVEKLTAPDDAASAEPTAGPAPPPPDVDSQHQPAG